MTLRSLLRAPLTAALLAALVGGPLLTAPSEAAPRPTATKAGLLAGTDSGTDDGSGKEGSLSRSPVHFPRSSYLCIGYTACSNAGMTPSGYAANNKNMYWRMYSGHNCTNYAAYRMVLSGLPNTRPWSGGGNATYWGTSNKTITNGTPSVGAVAWWKANTGPAGSAGHVAYVEKVVAADQIVISQDSWGGDFSWAVVTKASGNWPSGFVHFNDVPMLNTAAPKITGLAKVGTKLTASAGTWKPTDATVAYQWYANGVAVPGATAAALTVPDNLLADTLTVRTTATKMGYPTKAVVSAATAAVLPGSLLAVTQPTIRGVPKVDQTLTVQPGTWNVGQVTVTYQWYADGAPIPGATGTSLRLTPDLAGRVISLATAANRTSYTALNLSTAGTVPVALGTIRTLRAPRVSGTPHPGQVLTVDPGAYYPADATLDVQWLRNGQPIEGATTTAYRLTAADLGTIVTARVGVARSGYASTLLARAAAGRIRATPTVRVGTIVGRHHNARVTVRVTSPYVPRVDGTVVLHIQGVGTKEVTLRNGVAVLRMTGLARGRHQVTVDFRPTATLERVVKTTAFRSR